MVAENTSNNFIVTKVLPMSLYRDLIVTKCSINRKALIAKQRPNNAEWLAMCKTCFFNINKAKCDFKSKAKIELTLYYMAYTQMLANKDFVSRQ